MSSSSSSSSSSCWNHQHHSDIPYLNNSYPYNSPATFMEYFEGLTYQHVNFIFDGASHLQDTMYPSMHTSFYKFGLPDSGNFSYYDHAHTFSVSDHEPRTDEYSSLNNSARMTNDRPSTPAVNREWEPYENTTTHENPVECPRRHQNGHDHQVAWQDHIDPDTMTYEELLELGEAVGTQNRGLSQELLSLLPVSKYKRGFFSRKKSKNERCVICQMEYKRGDRRITLPCKHMYHAGCGSRWLSINKACPICYTEVLSETSKR